MKHIILFICFAFWLWVLHTTHKQLLAHAYWSGAASAAHAFRAEMLTNYGAQIPRVDLERRLKSLEEQWNKR
jgi:phosphopantetheine adenylyltransferase